jgi:hypothetical protein
VLRRLDKARRLQTEEIVLATGPDSLRDFDSQLERGRRLKTGNARLTPGAGAFHE